MRKLEDDKARQAFATVLRRRRNAKAWSQEELAHEAGIAMRYVSLLETNKRQPTISTIFALAGALRVPASSLIEEVETELQKAP